MTDARPGAALLAAGIQPMAPGVYLAEHLLPKHALTVAQAAERADLPMAVLYAIIQQRRAVDHAIAAKLSTLTGLAAGFWLNMQAAFDLTKH